MNTGKIKLRRSLRDPKPNANCIPDCSDAQKNAGDMVKRVKAVKPMVAKNHNATNAIKSSKKNVSVTSKEKSTQRSNAMEKNNEVVKSKVAHKGNTNVSKKNMRANLPVAGRICNKKFLRKAKERCGHFIIDCSEIAESIRINVGELNKFIKDQIKDTEEKNNGHVKVEVKNMKVFIDTDFYIEKSRFKELTKKYLKKNKLHNWIRVAAEKNKYVLKYFRAPS